MANLIPQMVGHPGWQKFRLEYEQSIINEFGTVARHNVLELHHRLEAARDLLDYMERQNVKTG